MCCVYLPKVELFLQVPNFKAGSVVDGEIKFLIKNVVPLPIALVSLVFNVQLSFLVIKTANF